MNLKNIFVIALLLTSSFQCFSQTASTNDTSKTVMDKGYPITLTLIDTISSKSSQTGDKVRFEVKDDVIINGRTVISKGTPGFGTITNVKPRAGLGKKGILEFTIDRLVFSSGKIINITSDQKAAGANKTGAMVATAAIISPLFLMKKGKDITYYPPKEFTAYTTEDYSF